MNTQSLLPQWVTDNLLVLVGANPLPCYLAAQLLLATDGQLHLIYTTDVSESIPTLSAHFANWCGHEIKNPANPREIMDAVQKALSECAKGSLGLNYTGGTKSMAVHAHRAAENWTAQHRSEIVLTYLDANTLSMYRDGHATPVSIQSTVNIEIEALLKLHGIQLDNSWPPERSPRNVTLCEALAQAHETERGQIAYDRWCNQHIRRTRQSDLDLIHDVIAGSATVAGEHDGSARVSINEQRAAQGLRGTTACRSDLVTAASQLASPSIPFPDDPVLADVTIALKNCFQREGDSFDPKEVAADPRLGFKSIKDLVKFLDGDWVEHWVLSSFQKVDKSIGMTDCATTLRTTQAPYDFEFDVAAIQGYQLHAVSCTRSNDRHLCKSKLFEAYIRASQLGGDEAKVALVCCDKKPAQLQQQVTEAWRAKRGHVMVFGPEHFSELPKRLSDWLQTI